MYAFQKEPTPYTCLNAKGFLAQNNQTGLTKWLLVRLGTKWLWVQDLLQSLKLFLTSIRPLNLKFSWKPMVLSHTA